jgi:hypothetical protein
VLDLSWVGAVGMLWYVGLNLLYGTFGGVLTQETKESDFRHQPSGIDK